MCLYLYLNLLLLIYTKILYLILIRLYIAKISNINRNHKIFKIIKRYNKKNLNFLKNKSSCQIAKKHYLGIFILFYINSFLFVKSIIFENILDYINLLNCLILYKP